MWIEIFHRGTLKTSLVWEKKGDKIKRIKWGFARNNLDCTIVTQLLYKIRQIHQQSIQWCNDIIGKKKNKTKYLKESSYNP